MRLCSLLLLLVLLSLLAWMLMCHVAGKVAECRSIFFHASTHHFVDDRRMNVM
jgi:hypothetical protein